MVAFQTGFTALLVSAAVCGLAAAAPIPNGDRAARGFFDDIGSLIGGVIDAEENSDAAPGEWDGGWPAEPTSLAGTTVTTTTTTTTATGIYCTLDAEGSADGDGFELSCGINIATPSVDLPSMGSPSQPPPPPPPPPPTTTTETYWTDCASRPRCSAESIKVESKRNGCWFWQKKLQCRKEVTVHHRPAAAAAAVSPAVNLIPKASVFGEVTLKADPCGTATCSRGGLFNSEVGQFPEGSFSFKGAVALGDLTAEAPIINEKLECGAALLPVDPAIFALVPGVVGDLAASAVGGGNAAFRIELGEIRQATMTVNVVAVVMVNGVELASVPIPGAEINVPIPHELLQCPEPTPPPPKTVDDVFNDAEDFFQGIFGGIVGR